MAGRGRAGKEVHLSPKALQLLELLVAEPPRVLVKTEIRDPRYLRSVHGLGYAFCGVVKD